MSKYVDGFILRVPNDKVEAYKEMAEVGKAVWMKHGALSYFECKGEDLVPKDMGGDKPLGFRELTKAQENETVWFSFVIFESKEARDEINAKVMEEMNTLYEGKENMPMPFDPTQMAYGGFSVEVEG